METPKKGSFALATTVRWVARVLCILAIVFIGMWSVEAVEGKVGLGRQILAFLMTPSFFLSAGLIIILLIAWRRELAGGILITFIGLATAVFAYVFTYSRCLHRASQGFRVGAPGRQVLNFFVLISLPLIVPGILFVISHFLHRPKKPTAQIP